MRQDPPRGAQSSVEGRRVAAGQRSLHDFTYFVVEMPQSDQAGERRAGRRTRTRLHEGLIAERIGGSIVDCRIRDLSHQGARLQLDKHRPLPRAFLLTDTATRQQFRVALIWQLGRSAGVRFLKG